jgi:hypothetical protein
MASSGQGSITSRRQNSFVDVTDLSETCKTREKTRAKVGPWPAVVNPFPSAAAQCDASFC